MNIDNLTLGEAKQLASLFNGNKESQDKYLGWRIVVLVRGFIYIGDCTLNDNILTITDAGNLTYWGTTKGLGELAENGPTSSTKYFHTGIVEAPWHSVIHLIPCEKHLWTK